MRWDELCGGLRPVLGVVVCRPLPGARDFAGDLPAVVAAAVAEASGLRAAGCAAVLVENRADGPHEVDLAPPETIAALARVLAAVVAELTIPVGVSVWRNDARAALGLAAAIGCRLVRVRAHVGQRRAADGLLTGRHSETLQVRSALRHDVVLLADVALRDADGASLRLAHQTWFHGLPDALAVHLPAGNPAEPLAALRRELPEAPLLAAGPPSPRAVAGLTAAAGFIVERPERTPEPELVEQVVAEVRRAG